MTSERETALKSAEVNYPQLTEIRERALDVIEDAWVAGYIQALKDGNSRDSESGLDTLKAGDRFIWKGYEWVCLDPDYNETENEMGIFALMANFYKDDIPFNTKEHAEACGTALNDFGHSTILEELDSLALELGYDDLIEHSVDPVADDGTDDYDKVLCRAFLLSCDEYRRYRQFIPLYDDWWWTCTPLSCVPGYARVGRVVYADGSLDYYSALYGYGLVPACIIRKR